MGVYNDMANDAGYAYGSDENEQMADALQDQERREWAAAQEAKRYDDEMHELAELTAEITRLRAALEQYNDAAFWVLNVAHGVSKGGGKPEHSEYVAAMDALQAATYEARRALGWEGAVW